MVRRILLAAVAAGALAGTGCRHKCCRPAPGVQPNPYLPPAPPQGGWLGNPTAPGGNNIPPASVPTTPAPSGGSFLPPSTGGSSPAVPPIFGPSTPAPQPSNTTPRPSNGRSPELLLPDSTPPAGTQSQYPGRGLLGDPVDPRKGQTTEPPLSKPTPADPDPLLKGAAPPPAGGRAVTGVTGFVVVKEGLASGRKPDLDGLDSLKQAGYRTLVYLHGPDADANALRAVAEKRGLTVETIEVTPENLADAWRKFNSTVRDTGNQPLFVCDDDGLRAGAMWYVYFRDSELMNADVARVRARGLGLTDATDEAKTFWVAIQRYFAPR